MNRVLPPTLSQQLRWLLPLIAMVLVGAGAFFRFYQLDHIPGLNGDDAWLPAQMRSYFSGGTFTFFTPTHRLISPTYFILHLPFQLFSAANMWLIRLPTALTSVLTVLAAFLLFRPFLNRPGVLLLTLLTATLPIQIAYARSLGEISQIGLIEVFLFFFLFRGSLLGVAIAFGVGLSVHPSFIFLTPLIVSMIVFHKLASGTLNRRVVGTLVAALAAVITWTFFAFPYGWASVKRHLIWNTTHFQEFFNFVVGVPRLFSGALVYQNFAGPLEGRTLLTLDLVGYAGLGFIFLKASCDSLTQKNKRTLAWMVGLLLTLTGFYLMTGALPFEPGTERLAFFLVFPITLTIAMTLQNSSGAAWVAVALSASLLVSFHKNYFSVFRQTGGLTHPTYRTTTEEPKKLALDWISRDRIETQNAMASVLVEDWWNFWPLTYFNFEKREFKVYRLNPDIVDPIYGNPSPPEKELKTFLSQGGYLVGFAEATLARKVSKWTDFEVHRHDVVDFSGRPVVTIWRKKIKTPSPN